MKKNLKTLFVFFILASLLTLSGCGCKQKTVDLNLKLEVWGFLDNRDALAEIFSNFKEIDPSIVSVSYRKLAVDTYKKELIEALASGQGPDIFMIHNTWLPGFSNKIAPVPAGLITEQDYRNNFVDVCVSDFITEGKIWAAPLSVDSIGLYYNKDLLNAAGITTPPKTWDEFIEDSRRMTKISSTGEIIQSGAAMGTFDNMNRPTDILNMLMMQNGARMADNNGRVNFSGEAAINALNFYTQFSKTDSASYSWNKRMHYSIDAFSEGNVAMMLNYSWHIQSIRDKSPKLNFAVTEVPQVSGSMPVNYGNYWAYAVSNNKVMTAKASDGTAVSNEERIGESWKFLTYLTMKTDMAAASGAKSGLGKSVDLNLDPAADYLSMMKMPAARRDLIEKQLTDPDLGPFAKSNLTAKSWKQINPESTEAIMGEMINKVNSGEYDAATALLNAAAQINQAISK